MLMLFGFCSASGKHPGAMSQNDVEKDSIRLATSQSIGLVLHVSLNHYTLTLTLIMIQVSRVFTADQCRHGIEWWLNALKLPQTQDVERHSVQPLMNKDRARIELRTFVWEKKGVGGKQPRVNCIWKLRTIHFSSLTILLNIHFSQFPFLPPSQTLYLPIPVSGHS